MRLFNEGLCSIHILNACRRSQVLTSDHFHRMKFPQAIEMHLLSPPDEPIETHGDVDELKEWLCLCLGGLTLPPSPPPPYPSDSLSLSVCLSLSLLAMFSDLQSSLASTPPSLGQQVFHQHEAPSQPARLS
jgi:hypothetical protein